MGGLALVGLDGLTLVAGPAEVFSLSSASAIERLLTTIAQLRPKPGDPVDLLRVPVERGWPGKIVWISDFADPEAVAPGLDPLG